MNLLGKILCGVLDVVGLVDFYLTPMPKDYAGYLNSPPYRYEMQLDEIYAFNEEEKAKELKENKVEAEEIDAGEGGGKGDDTELYETENGQLSWFESEPSELETGESVEIGSEKNVTADENTELEGQVSWFDENTQLDGQISWFDENEDYGISF